MGIRGGNNMTSHDFGHRWHEKQIGTVDDEIARLSFILGIPLLDPGVVERVVAGDESVCRKANPAVFRKLKGLVGMHYTLTNDSLQALGREQTAKVLAEIRERLQPKFKLGGAPP
jgi:hypothetical protein